MALSEDDIIKRFFAPIAGDGADGLKDDCAVIETDPNQKLILNADTLVAGVHFFKDDQADLIAKKALRVNLSDLAAKGATPLGYLLSLTLPKPIDIGWLDAFSRGLKEDQQAFGLALLGGDTTSTPGPITLSVTMWGAVARETRVPRRGGAKDGDAIYVTGSLGDSALGLQCLLHEKAGYGRSPDELSFVYLTDRYWLPQPRVQLIAALGNDVHASMDISDGLIIDASRMAMASGHTFSIEHARIPVSEASRMAVARWPEHRDAIFTGGDDYELLFTSTLTQEQITSALCAVGLGAIPVTRIGKVEAGEARVTLLDANGCEMNVQKQGFTHF